MTTLRKLIKGKKHRKLTKKKLSKIKINNTNNIKSQKGGQEPDKPNPKNDEIDITNDDLFNNINLNNENKSAKVGAYNKNEFEDELTGIAKELQKTQGGLSFQYPGPLNITQEQALKDKLNNVREEGFPGLEMKSTEQFKPKINFQKMYESDLLSSTLVIPINEFDTDANNYKSKEQLEVEEMNQQPKK